MGPILRLTLAIAQGDLLFERALCLVRRKRLAQVGLIVPTLLSEPLIGYDLRAGLIHNHAGG